MKPTHTFEELLQAAKAQRLRIEENAGKYRVVNTRFERLGLVTVAAGLGYSLNLDQLRKFLIFNSIDIGERLTDWRKERGHKPPIAN